MALLLKKSYSLYRYVFDELSDPRTSDWFMVGGLGPVALLLAGYLYFVLSLGPRLMRHRKPFQLDRVLVVYNAVQVVCSLHVVYEAIVCCFSGQHSLFCQPMDYSNDETALRIARGFWFYYMLKIADLLDTVFFVLRKKSKQISFLHVYHHTGMIMIGYSSTKFLPGGHSAFIGLANSLVHAIMYSYYLITILHPKYKQNIWWKKYITQMQMVQFACISLHSVQLLFQPNCTYPKFTIGVVVPQNVFLFFLFYDFYRKAYMRSGKKAAQVDSRAGGERPAEAVSKAGGERPQEAVSNAGGERPAEAVSKAGGERPAEAVSKAGGERPAETVSKAGGERPAEAVSKAGGERPTEAISKAGGERPAEAVSKAGGERPAETVSKAGGERPAEAVSKAGGERPTEAISKAGGERPAEAVSKAGGERPAETVNKAGGERPAEAVSKAGGERPHQAVSKVTPISSSRAT